VIAFLGTGLLGTGFVRAALGRGETVTVWNRTRAKADALATEGARVAADPADAVRGASRVHLVLLDDAVVDAVTEQLLPGLAPDAIILDHSTTAPRPTAARAQRLAALGIDFLHVPVFMGPAQAAAATGMMLVSGKQALYERVRPELARMTERIRYMGERPDLAAAYKLFGNMLIMFVSAGLADVFAMARAAGIEPTDAYTIFNDFNAAAQVATRGKRMAEGDFTPSFELAAARKDVRLMLETAEAGGVPLHVLPAIAARFDQVIAAGHGADDLASVGATDVP
jgi:3-hydroxyisobutyrate dehydrogenase-like beta-hydroxyacid dehydrogenase